MSAESHDSPLIFDILLLQRSYAGGYAIVNPGGGIIPHEEALKIIEQILRFYNNVSLEQIVGHNNAEVAEKQTKAPASRRTKLGYVYLLQSPTGAYKIGVASNPTKRIERLEVKLPFEIEPVCVIQTDDMYGLEKALHRQFADKRVNGEWFRLSNDDVEIIKQMAVESC